MNAATCLPVPLPAVPSSVAHHRTPNSIGAGTTIRPPSPGIPHLLLPTRIPLPIPYGITSTQSCLWKFQEPKRYSRIRDRAFPSELPHNCETGRGSRWVPPTLQKRMLISQAVEWKGNPLAVPACLPASCTLHQAICALAIALLRA